MPANWKLWYHAYANQFLMPITEKFELLCSLFKTMTHWEMLTSKISFYSTMHAREEKIEINDCNFLKHWKEKHSYWNIRTLWWTFVKMFGSWLWVSFRMVWFSMKKPDTSAISCLYILLIKCWPIHIIMLHTVVSCLIGNLKSVNLGKFWSHLVFQHFGSWV